MKKTVHAFKILEPNCADHSVNFMEESLIFSNNINGRGYK
jgi:hypothetical protein